MAVTTTVTVTTDEHINRMTNVPTRMHIAAYCTRDAGAAGAHTFYTVPNGRVLVIKAMWAQSSNVANATLTLQDGSSTIGYMPVPQTAIIGSPVSCMIIVKNSLTSGNFLEASKDAYLGFDCILV